MEAGGANLGIFVGLLVGYLLNIGQHAISCILLIFFEQFEFIRMYVVR